ncbi:unnamed protein product [Pedinophyceae sp. YPF-701]|nr:unnamed protein product [Pedinophyceae sp. YPF-701]
MKALGLKDAIAGADEKACGGGSSPFSPIGQVGASIMTLRKTMHDLRMLEKPIDKYMFLRALYERSPELHFQLLMTNTEETLPFIYTPTVGEACQRYGELGIQTRGCYITPADRGNMAAKLAPWTSQNIRVIVVTDGERILGLGDLGAGGMGISEGKILLYTAAACVNPNRCLPVCLDVGTNNEALRSDPTYQGVREPRLRGEEYDSFVREFMETVKDWAPHCLIQFEDFGNQNAFRILEMFQPDYCCFNDDIQGTACIALAGFLAALRASGGRLADQRVLFLGAGEAGTGIGELIAQEVARQTGAAVEDARRACFFLDSRGLVCKDRPGKLQHHKVPFAHDVPFLPDLLSAVEELRPTALVGVSAQARTFTEAVVRKMAELNERPIIFPLSNPTHLAECTFAEAMEWTDGRVVFASGSPFAPLERDGREFYPAQANNAYVFPAVGHAAVLTRATNIPPDAFLIAAETLSGMSDAEDIEAGSLFPRFTEIKDVSVEIMAAVAAWLVEQGVGSEPERFGGDWKEEARRAMWTAPGALGTPSMRLMHMHSLNHSTLHDSDCDLHSVSRRDMMALAGTVMDMIEHGALETA